MFSPPTNLQLVSKTTASAVLSWGPPVNGASVQYNVYRDRKLIAPGLTGVLTYTDSSVSANHRYQFAVTGVTAGVESAFSNFIDVDIEPSANLDFEVVFQEMPGEGGYPDVLWRWM